MDNANAPGILRAQLEAVANAGLSPKVKHEITLSATKYHEGPQAGLNRRMRRALASSNKARKDGVRAKALEMMRANVSAELDEIEAEKKAKPPEPQMDESLRDAIVAASQQVNQFGGTPSIVVSREGEFLNGERVPDGTLAPLFGFDPQEGAPATGGSAVVTDVDRESGVVTVSTEASNG